MTTETKIDLFGLADANKGWLESEYQRIKNKSHGKKPALLENLRIRVKNEWHLSINLSDRKLAGALELRKYMNVYELVDLEIEKWIREGILEKSSARSEREKELKIRLKSFYEMRTVFDSSIDSGFTIKYASLNIGGIGTTTYGKFCIIIKSEKAKKYKNLAFIKEDSARNYVANRCLLYDKLAREVANRDFMDILAVVKHENEIETVSSDKWGRMVCDESNYIEALTTDTILMSHIRFVRVDKTYYNRIFENYRDLMVKNSNELSEAELYRLDEVQKIFSGLEKSRIKWELIDEH